MATPYEALGAIATQRVAIAPRLEHVETFTMQGLLTSFWHWPDEGAEAVVVCCGGAMGGLLGPADGLYHDLGEALAAAGIGVVRVGWRKPNDLERCLHDLLAVLELTTRRGATRAVTVGHSFGGAVAVQAGVVAEVFVAGVVTLATQSAGCEVAAGLAGRPVLCLHGDRDELLPVACSELVAELSGGTVEVLPGAGHLLVEAGTHLRDRLTSWLPEVLGCQAPP